jgi:hypothetical protein
MITTEHEEILWVLHFESKHESDGFQALFTTVNVVTKEKIIGLWGKATILKHAEEVVVLAVYVTAEGNWCFEL